MPKLAEVRKALTAEAVGIVGWFAATPDLHHVTKTGWIALAIVVLSGLGVYVVPNDLSAGDQLAADAQQGGYVYQEGQNGPTTATASATGGLGLGDSTPGSSMPQQPVQADGGGHSGTL